MGKGWNDVKDARAVGAARGMEVSAVLSPEYIQHVSGCSKMVERCYVEERIRYFFYISGHEMQLNIR